MHDSLTASALRAALGRPPVEQPGAKMAAVAAVFDANLDLLLISRAERPGDPWSGHVALPGGRVEPGDAGPLAGAMREAAEEVGIDLAPAAVLGQLDDLVTIGGLPEMVIRPFVFHLDVTRPELRTNDEVAAVHWRPLATLLQDHGRTSMRWERADVSLELPCVWFDDRRLWGLTLAIVDDLLDRLDGRGGGLRRVRPPGA